MSIHGYLKKLNVTLNQDRKCAMLQRVRVIDTDKPVDPYKRRGAAVV